MIDLSKPLHYRPETNDLAIWEYTYNVNEYQLPDDMIGWRVIDIGAHIGSFAAACLVRGATEIYCFEPVKSSFDLLVKNMEPVKDKVECHNYAIWSGETTLYHGPLEHNSGGMRTYADAAKLKGAAATAVEAIPLDPILQLFPYVNLLKFDCEGAEHTIIPHCTELQRCDRIFGEFHSPRDDAIGSLGGMNEQQSRGLPFEFRKHGFRLHWWPHGAKSGMFQATRGEPNHNCGDPDVHRATIHEHMKHDKTTKTR